MSINDKLEDFVFNDQFQHFRLRERQFLDDTTATRKRPKDWGMSHTV